MSANPKHEPASEEPASEGMRQRLKELHRALLHLHKTLLELERQSYERTNGRINSAQLLQLAISNEQFAWLRTISAFIVRIDELMELKPPASDKDIQMIFDEARYLLYASEHGNEFERRFNALLQREPAAVLAQKEVSAVLSQKQ